MKIEKGHFTENDCLKEALVRLARKSDKDKVSVEEILKEDNKIRAEAGLEPISEYPIMEKEYKPSEKKAYFWRLIGAEIKREPRKLPQIFEIYEDCEGFDAVDYEDDLKDLVVAQLKIMLPNQATYTKEERAFALKAVIIQKRAALAKSYKEEDAKTPEVVAEQAVSDEMAGSDEKAVLDAPRRGRPKKG